MRTTAHPEGTTRDIEVPDEEIVAAYLSGGMGAVEDLFIAAADSIRETPFWFPEHVSEYAVKQIVKEYHATND